MTTKVQNLRSRHLGRKVSLINPATGEPWGGLNGTLTSKPGMNDKVFWIVTSDNPYVAPFAIFNDERVSLT